MDKFLGMYIRMRMDGFSVEDIFAKMRDEQVVKSLAEFKAGCDTVYISEFEESRKDVMSDVSVLSLEFVERQVTKLSENANTFEQQEKVARLSSDIRYKFGKEIEDFIVNLKEVQTEDIIKQFIDITTGLLGSEVTKKKLKEIVDAN